MTKDTRDVDELEITLLRQYQREATQQGNTRLADAMGRAIDQRIDQWNELEADR